MVKFHGHMKITAFVNNRNLFDIEEKVLPNYLLFFENDNNNKKNLKQFKNSQKSNQINLNGIFHLAAILLLLIRSFIDL